MHCRPERVEEWNVERGKARKEEEKEGRLIRSFQTASSSLVISDDQ